LPHSDPDNCNWCTFIERTGKIGNKTQDTNTSTEPVIQVPSCPQCSGPMRLRTGKFGEFWSCLGFPDCKGLRKGMQRTVKQSERNGVTAKNIPRFKYDKLRKVLCSI